MPEKKSDKLLKKSISIGGVSLAQKVEFARNLAVMIKSGLTIVDALRITRNSAQGKFKNSIEGVLKSVESGNSLSSSLARYPKIFSGMFVSATYAGESSGTLEKNLDNLAEHLEKKKELTSKIKGAMLYPIVVLIAAFILGLAMAFLVLPKIIPLFEGLKTDLPLTTRILIKSSHFIDAHGLALFLGIVIFVVFMSWLLKQKFVFPITHWLWLRTPIVKRIIINSNLATFNRTLGLMLKSGLNINEALSVLNDTFNNYYYKKIIYKANESVSRGIKLSNHLAQYEKLFPKMVVSMIKVGEESGNLEETLYYLANYYEVEVDNATKSLSTAIEPILLIFIGLFVGFLALSIITPIYSITGSIK